MGVFRETSLLCTKDLIWNVLFKSPIWAQKMAEEGLTPMLLGSDLERFDSCGSILYSDSHNPDNQPVYLAIILTADNGDHPLTNHKWGYPHRDLFFDCLNPWMWYDQRRHDIKMKNSNVILNLGEYDRRTQPSLKLTTIAAIDRLGRARSNESERHICALSHRDQVVGHFALYLDSLLNVVLKVGAAGNQVWQFRELDFTDSNVHPCVAENPPCRKK